MALLVVQPDPDQAQRLDQTLRRMGYDLWICATGWGSLRAAAWSPPEMVLLDSRLPDLECYTVREYLARDPATADTPVIYLAWVEDALLVQARTHDPDQMVIMPFIADELHAAVRTGLTERVLRRFGLEPPPLLQAGTLRCATCEVLWAGSIDGFCLRCANLLVPLAPEGAGELVGAGA